MNSSGTYWILILSDVTDRTDNPVQDIKWFMCRNFMLSPDSAFDSRTMNSSDMVEDRSVAESGL